jgi:hypothetical protein
MLLPFYPVSRLWKKHLGEGNKILIQQYLAERREWDSTLLLSLAAIWQMACRSDDFVEMQK